ncbi:MAG: EAL domain-containing protein [Lachnospiraceae bacterium]
MKPESIQRISIEQFKNIIKILKPCMDDYLYIYDLQNDYYCISPKAAERFLMTETEFHQVPEHHAAIVYPEDRELITEDLNQILRGEKDFHNLQYRWLDKERKPVWINCRGRVTVDEEGKPEFLIGCINEIGKKQKADNVSGLLGESSLRNEINQKNRERLQGFMLRIGIDHFKEINENKGMDYGDMILQKTAECIHSVCSPEQKVYRIVADEFVIVDFSDKTAEDARRLYNKIRWKINLFIEENGYEVFYTISAGILMFDSVVNQEYFNLMKLSEFALSEAKNNGKNKYYVYERKDYHDFRRRKDVVRIMRHAINADFDGFEANFQPIMNLKENRMLSAETLLRFSSEETGRISPAEFVPLLEESGLIIPVGKWILHQAMQACKKIRETVPEFRVSVNLSYIQVLKSDVLKEIVSALEQYDLPADSIMIELTESGFLEQNDNFIRFCEGLKKYGIPLALDDFGTGYSNFHYLYNLSPNVIKVDRSFTLKALSNDYEYSLLRHMVDMTHSIDLKFCIEGIETQQELNKISQMGPDYIQGYFFGKPCAFPSFLDAYVNPVL